MCIKEFIKLGKEAEQERINLLNLTCKKILDNEEAGKLEFLNLLFEMNEKKLTLSDFKSRINKLYAAKKNLNKHYISEGKNNISDSNFDLLATSILALDHKVVNSFFKLSYDFINRKNYTNCIKVETWVNSLNGL